MTFGVDSNDVTDGYQVGDVVDVTYVDNGDGTYTADDLEWVEQDSTGTVTDVSEGSVTHHRRSDRSVSDVRRRPRRWRL
jgi:hypothetical protein